MFINIRANNLKLCHVTYALIFVQLLNASFLGFSLGRLLRRGLFLNLFLHCYHFPSTLSMPRHNVALYLPHPLPSLPIEPPPTPSPLQQVIASTLSTTDYDHVSLPLTNTAWQARWEKLCLRPIEEEGLSEEELERRAIEERKVDQEADVWRRDGGLKRSEVVVSRLEESQGVIPLASEWLELDSPDEGIRFDSELVGLLHILHDT